MKHLTLPAVSRPSSEDISDEATRRFNILKPIVAHEKKTPERRAAKAAVLLAHPAVKERTLMHFDHIVTRPDGSTAYPKAIVFADRATHQAFMAPFLLDKGEGIRQQHVAWAIERFISLHGVLETFYIDNGGEFGAVNDLSDILQLVQQRAARPSFTQSHTARAPRWSRRSSASYSVHVCPAFRGMSATTASTA